MRLFKWSCLTFTFIFLLVFQLQGAEKPALSIQLNVEKYQLPNGLTVILHEDHSAPIISYHTWFRVGSKDEKLGRTGLAHFLEHLMFKGAKRYTGKQFDQLMQANGISNNAFTSLDYTGYYENLPSSKLELIMDMESDRLQNLALRPEDFQSEKEVVKEERRSRVDNQPLGKMREVVYHTAYKVSPYKWPVIGRMTDLNRISIKDVRAFWQKFYSPSNAVLVIVGDFNSRRVKRMIEKYYGSIPGGKTPVRNYAKEPLQQGQRSVTLRKNISSPYFSVAYKIPGAGEKDVFALDLLAQILGKGSSSRLYKRLVYREQSVLQIGVSSYTPKEGGLFRITGAIPPGENSKQQLEKAIRSVFAEIWKSSHHLVSDKELQKAKTQVMKSYVDSLTTMAGKAEILALNEVLFGSYKVFFKDLQNYQSVTAEQIKEVAEKYLKPSQRSVVRLLPKEDSLN